MRSLTGILPALIPVLLAMAVASCTPGAHAPTASAHPTMNLGPAATETSPYPPGISERRVVVQGQARAYFIYIPEALNLTQPTPALFVFHGYGEDGLQALAYTGFDEIAAAQGFIAVYPNGTGLGTNDLSWNAGGCCGYAAIGNVDESSFVRSILSDLKGIATVDPKRVYATGFANGGMLSYRLGCEMSDVFAAVAPVAGDLFYYGSCQLQEPVSLIHVHGLGDKVIPYGGTSLPGFGEQYPPVSYGIATWAQLDGCMSVPQVTQQGNTTLTAYTSCHGGSAVELYAVRGFGHAWPTADQAGGLSSQVIWEFLAAHPRSQENAGPSR